MNRQLHLNLFIHSRGHHEASWRHPAASPLPLTDIRYYQDLAQRAEAAHFDSIFLADQLALGDDVAQAARTWLEPITVLAAVAAATSRIGLIATASTTYTEPFNLARQFASLDHISNGRVGWNIVTSWLAAAAHEIPQELGDFGVLLHGGWSPRQALLWNLLSGLTFLVGSLTAYAVASELSTDFLLAFAAGNFLYIASADLIPELTKAREARTKLLHVVLVLAGAGVLLAARLLLAHEH